MNIRAWASTRLNGLDDIWTPLQFDAAVTLFGNWCEGELNKLDDAGKPVYTLEDLIQDKAPGIEKFMQQVSGLNIKGISVRKVSNGG